NEISFSTSLYTLNSSSKQESRAMGVNYIVEEEEWPLYSSQSSSRVTPTLSLHGSAGMLGYLHSGTWGTSVTPYSDLNNIEFFFSGDQLTSNDTPVYWSDISDSGKDSLRVYAYSPKSLGNTPVGGESPLGVAANGVPTINYTVPHNVLQQHDLITATSLSVDKDYRTPISLPFTHALTAIRFKVDIDCTIKSISVNNVYNKGTYIFGEDWVVDNMSKDSYTIPGDSLVKESHTLMLLPQDLPDGSEVVLVYNDGAVDDKTIRTDISSFVWEPGKLITYTLYAAEDSDYIYFDLAAGKVNISPSGYSGYVYVSGYAEPQLVQGSHLPTNTYYVYQSSTSDKPEFAAFNKYNTGYKSYSDFQNMVNCYIPDYDPVKYNEELWSNYITNNTNVEEVIEVWDDAKYVRGADVTGENKKNVAVVRDVGRTHTTNTITVLGGAGFVCKMTIDNLYSTYQSSDKSGYRVDGPFNYKPQTANSKLYVNIVGDNRFGNIHYCNFTRGNESEIIFDGTGSLTVADADFYKGKYNRYSISGYYSNHHASVIGGSDEESNDKSYGIRFKGGVIFAGSTTAENCSA
ncbi:MAG: fimbrillin family protein, partial [Bacteroidaceae bacterium]|nr:fimbrillin family protein [Bacteroidaceae bacterium]